MTAVRLPSVARRLAALVLLVWLALILRLLWLDASPLRGDEAFAIQYWAAPWPDALALASIEPHPVGTFALFAVWKATFGDGEWVMRLLPTLLSLPGLAAIYTLGRQLFRRRRVALLAALLYAVHPFLIWHAQDVRNYAIWTSTELIALAGPAGRPAPWPPSRLAGLRPPDDAERLRLLFRGLLLASSRLDRGPLATTSLEALPARIAADRRAAHPLGRAVVCALAQWLWRHGRRFRPGPTADLVPAGPCGGRNPAARSPLCALDRPPGAGDPGPGSDLARPVTNRPDPDSGIGHTGSDAGSGLDPDECFSPALYCSAKWRDHSDCGGLVWGFDYTKQLLEMAGGPGIGGPARPRRGRIGRQPLRPQPSARLRTGAAWATP